MGYHLVLAKRKLWSTLFVLLLFADHFSCKRGGGGGFGGRGSSGARMGGSRGSNGGGFGGGTYNRGGYNPGGVGGRTGSSAGAFGGAYHNKQYDARSKSGGGWFGGGKQSRPSYTKGTGVGSMVRSNTFKNMIVGAAAGYLTYQAGKAIIRHAVAPMMWNNRPYYWGSNYYQQRPGQSMCRMPIDNNDQQFGNIYFADSSRPREIVWGCGMNEHCCGSECCPSGYGGGGYGGGYSGGGYYGGSGRHWGGGIGLGTILTLLLLCACGGFIVHQLCKTRRATSGQSLFGGGGGGSWFGGTKYTPGQQATPNEPPPQYEPNSTANFTYPPPPPGNNYTYPAAPKV